MHGLSYSMEEYIDAAYQIWKSVSIEPVVWVNKLAKSIAL